MRKAWFCYELDFAGRWCPVIYYDEPPPKSLVGKEQTKTRKQITKVPWWLIQADNEYSFSRLQLLYPLSKVLQKETSDAIVKSTNGEQPMARPVSGFQTSQGNFFDTEEEANLFEATYELDNAATAAVREELGDQPQENIETIATGIRSFITKNEKAIREYLDARAAFTEKESRERDAVDRSAAVDNTEDDPSLRSEETIPVAETPDPEAVAPKPRTTTKSS